MAAVSVENYAIFAGGRSSDHEENIVDIFNVETGLWSKSSLSAPRSQLAACVDLRKLRAYFAGGLHLGKPSGIVDVFDHQNISFSTGFELAVPRYSLSCITHNEFVYFAGGISSTGPSSTIELYNSNNFSWFFLQLSSPRHSISAVLVGATIYFAGGSLSIDSTFPLESSAVDIFDTVSKNWTNRLERCILPKNQVLWKQQNQR
jgi:hypothetical protein